MKVARRIDQIVRYSTEGLITLGVTAGQLINLDLAVLISEQALLAQAALIASFYFLDLAVYFFLHPKLYGEFNKFHHQLELSVGLRAGRDTAQALTTFAGYQVFNMMLIYGTITAAVSSGLALLLTKFVIESYYNTLTDHYEAKGKDQLIEPRQTLSFRLSEFSKHKPIGTDSGPSYWGL